jgi:hypothetical protein
MQRPVDLTVVIKVSSISASMQYDEPQTPGHSWVMMVLGWDRSSPTGERYA